MEKKIYKKMVKRHIYICIIPFSISYILYIIRLIFLIINFEEKIPRDGIIFLLSFIVIPSFNLLTLGYIFIKLGYIYGPNKKKLVYIIVAI